MGQPTPPGDMPLFEGLGTEWNEIVGAFPEDKRAELAPKLKARIDAYEPLKQWEDFQKSGITAEQASNALNLYSTIENNPKQVYETLGKYLGVTKEEVKEVVEATQQEINEDPRLKAIQQQVDTLSQIMLAQRQQSDSEQQAAEAEAALEKEMNALKKKYSDVDEEEIIMRMIHNNVTAEQAYQDYSAKIAQIRERRPAPSLLGSGGTIPRRDIDPAKLDSKDTKNLVAQMLEHANHQRRG